MKIKEEMGQELPDAELPDPEYDQPIETIPAPPLIYARISAVMAEIGAIGKDQQNRQQGFKYRGIDDVYNSLHSAFAKHEIFTTSEILKRRREERTTPKGAVLIYTMLRIKYTFHTVDGSCVSTVVEGEGMDSGDKSANKAMAVAHKYALLQAFMVPTEEAKDPDRESHAVEPKPTKAQGVTKRQRQNIDPDIVRAIMACEDMETLQEMWAKVENKPLYDGTKNLRKDQLGIEQADKDQASL